jgi:Uma2 family endonuclease
MSENYQELLAGEAHTRIAPRARHEQVCARIHRQLGSSLANQNVSRLLPVRSEVHVSSRTIMCPDLAVVTVATGKVWLAAEVINSDDHRLDTVIKKDLYEEMKIPRLWMVDPRYNNVELYECGEYGMTLKGILAGREVLEEKLLPGFQFVIADLFAA